MQKITPFLWFDNQAEEAMNFYTSVFKDSKILTMKRMSDNGPVFSGTIQLNGQEFHFMNGGPLYSFTPAISLFVDCENQAEVDYYWNKLIEGGKESRCGWLVDKFGLSWQIIPKALGKLLSDKDPVKANNALQAMLKMNKIDVAKLEEACNSLNTIITSQK